MMQKLTLIIGLLVAANILFAQGKREQIREKAVVKIEEYKERLNLSDKQVNDLKDLREEMKPEFEALKKDESKSRSDKMRLHADLIDKREARVEEILTDDQFAELQIIKKEVKQKRIDVREKRKERKKDRRGDG